MHQPGRTSESVLNRGTAYVAARLDTGPHHSNASCDPGVVSKRRVATIRLSAPSRQVPRTSVPRPSSREWFRCIPSSYTAPAPTTSRRGRTRSPIVAARTGVTFHRYRSISRPLEGCTPRTRLGDGPGFLRRGASRDVQERRTPRRLRDQGTPPDRRSTLRR